MNQCFDFGGALRAGGFLKPPFDFGGALQRGPFLKGPSVPAAGPY